LTTLVVGARLQQNFVVGDSSFLSDNNFFPVSWLWTNPWRLLGGIPFSATLLGILLAHEMGHFIYSVRHRVYATLPFFLPFPSPWQPGSACWLLRSTCCPADSSTAVTSSSHGTPPRTAPSRAALSLS